MDIVGVLYALFFVYEKETANLVVATLVPRHILKSIRHVLLDGIKNTYHNIFKRNLLIDPDTDNISSESIKYETMQIKIQEPPEKSESFFPGTLKIVFFFYQTSVLFKVYSVGKSHEFIHFLEEVIVA